MASAAATVVVWTNGWRRRKREHTAYPVKGSIQYFDGVDVEDCSRSVADEAAARAKAALLRRRPDLSCRGGQSPEVPGEEEAQVVLDTLAFVREVADRLHADLTALVFEARRLDASWARVGLALQESPQTAFNRYRHLEEPPPRAKTAGSRQKRQAGR